ncbi:MAG: hypothetical protein KAX84_13305 [Burkholderiales bacterium]|nr:hypothetical protein [Burkholderiales bacterium]
MGKSRDLRPACRAASNAGRGAAALALGLAAEAARASFNGPIDLGFGTFFVAAAVLALPGALLCALAEWLCARRRPPVWVGIAALGLAVYCLARALRFLPPSVDSGLFIFPAPPLMTFALVSLVPAPRWRRCAVWFVTIGTIWLGLSRQQLFGPSTSTAETLGGLLGGALTSLLLWELAFVPGQRALRRAGIAPAAGPDLPSLAARATALRRRISMVRPQWLGRLLKQPGFVWWLGGAALFYVGIAVLSAAGIPSLLAATLYIDWRIADFLGFAVRGPDAATMRAWAMHGLVWAAIAGAGAWGAAAVAGRFDAGRLAPVRLAAIVLAAGMLLWAASIASAASF